MKPTTIFRNSALLFAFSFYLITFAPAAHAAISNGSVTGNTAADLVVGTTGADYNVSFNTNTASTATSILITFPAGYTITDGGLGTPSTAICSSGCSSSGAISIGNATTSVSGVTGSAAARTISIALTSAQNLSTGTTSFRFLLGIQNPTTSGLTGTFTASTSANGEVAQAGIAGVTLTAATATTLVFTTQPSNSTSGVALGTQPVVTARDQYGNTATSFAEVITFTEASAGSLTNSATTAVSGVATATNLIYTASADQESFVLTASSSSLTATSSAVISNVVATKIIVATQPASPGSGQQLSPQPIIYFADAQNTLDTLANTDTVTVALQAGSGTLTGSTIKAAVNGVVTFSDLVYTTTNSSEATTLRFTDNAGGTNNFSAAPIDAASFSAAVSGSSRDRTPPMVFWLSPLNGESGVSTSTSLAVEFHEIVKVGAGAITIRNATNGATAATFAATDPSVEILGKLLRIRLSSPLVSGTTYAIDLGHGIVLDQENNAFAGMGATQWQFATFGDAPTSLSISTVTIDAKADEATSTSPESRTALSAPLTDQSKEIFPSPSPVHLLPPFTGTLRRGSSGDEVRQLQMALAKDSALYPEGLVTGYFGPATERAVQRLQEKYRIVFAGEPGSGVVGPRTRAQLNVLFAGAALPTTAAISKVYVGAPRVTVNLYPGLLHEEVRQLQRMLNRDADTRIAESGPGSPENESTFFGDLTKRAVERFQSKHGIASPSDPGYGFVGPRTREKLNELFGI